MNQPWQVLVFELIALGATGYGLWDSIMERWRQPITPDLVRSGRKKSLKPWFRRKQDRTVEARVRRWMYAVEVAAKRLAEKR